MILSLVWYGPSLDGHEWPCRPFSGITVGVYGSLVDCNKFSVLQFVYASLLPSITRRAPVDEDAFVLLVSGLSFGDPDARPGACEMLADWLAGLLGGSAVSSAATRPTRAQTSRAQDELEQARRVRRVIIAGNSIDERLASGDHVGQLARYVAKKTVTPTLAAAHALDDFLCRVAVSRWRARSARLGGTSPRRARSTWT